jgi:hypothetical protein
VLAARLVLLLRLRHAGGGYRNGPAHHRFELRGNREHSSTLDLRRRGRFLDDVRPVLVLEAVENARVHEPPSCFFGIRSRGVFDEDEDLVGVATPRKMRSARAFSRARGRSCSNNGRHVS